jgi:hypothetical protein
MFFIPMGLFVKSDSAFAAQHAVPGMSHLSGIASWRGTSCR